MQARPADQTRRALALLLLLPLTGVAGFRAPDVRGLRDPSSRGDKPVCWVSTRPLPALLPALLPARADCFEFFRRGAL